jgi:hypothetical protein
MFYIFISTAAPCMPKRACASTRAFPYSRPSLSACLIAVAGVGVLFILSLGMFALNVTASISLAWIMCCSPLSLCENEFRGNHKLDLDH